MRTFKIYFISVFAIIIFIPFFIGSSSNFSPGFSFNSSGKIHLLPFKPDISSIGVNLNDTIVYGGLTRNIIKYNHKVHIEDAGLGCSRCHYKAASSDISDDYIYPEKKICAKCHNVADKNECVLCHFLPIKSTIKLMSPKRDIIFSHKFHLGKQMTCAECHKDISSVKYASESPDYFPTMKSCFNCHDGILASNGCESCHKNLTNLVPYDHLNSNFLTEHRYIYDVSSARSDKECLLCHTDNFCQVCHSSSSYSGKNIKSDFYAPYQTKESGIKIERATLQKLTNMHSLNYVYTHGIESDYKTFECKTCHDYESFCSPCHQTGGNIVSGIAPKNHLQPNFTTIGVNSGGGLHSQLAKREIERCQACHNTDGADPVCVKCHFDNDGIIGTNPKTHIKGFLKDDKGIWHDTQGAICYVCHTDGNARPYGIKGIGFCGYCHR
ncbi:MAG: cytochrome C [Ignavibacteria bacterium]|nr:cytochrome C [Ignavibacteria bacterium]